MSGVKGRGRTEGEWSEGSEEQDKKSWSEWKRYEAGFENLSEGRSEGEDNC